MDLYFCHCSYYIYVFDLCNYPAVPTDIIDIVTHLSLYKLWYLLRDWLWSGWQEVVRTSPWLQYGQSV